MKKPFFAWGFRTLPALLLLAAAAVSGPLHAETKSFTLENGLQIFLHEKHTLPLVNMVFAFNVGSKDETLESSGLVHILEHYILFRGTRMRSGEEIGQDIRRHGAYFNAHTGRDLSVFEMTLPVDHIDFAFQNQKEILFDIRFDQTELDKEKEVILEELNNAEDDPFRLASTLVYQNLYRGHPYEKPIAGSRSVILGATTEQLENFHRSYFVASNAALAVVGDFSISELEPMVRRHFESLPRGEVKARKREPVPPLKKVVRIEKELDVNMAYLAVGLPAPDFNNPDQYAMDILTEIMGRGVNPMLNHPLMKRRIQVNSLRMGYSAQRDGGGALIFISVDPKHLKRTERELLKYLKDARRLDYSDDDVFGDAQFYAVDYVTSARNRLRFQGERAQETGLNIAVSLARFMLMNQLPDRGNYLDRIADIKSSDLRASAGRYLSSRHYVVVVINPKKGRAP